MTNNITAFPGDVKTYTISNLNGIVESLIDKGKECVVVFSMYKLGEDIESDDYTVTSSDLLSTKPIFKGKCVFSIDYWRISPKPVYSKEYIDPTWKDIINACNDLLINGDRCGVYLESINFVKKTDGVSYFEFGIGS